MTPNPPHPTDTALKNLLTGRLPEPERIALADHIAGCPDCAVRLALLAEADPVSAPRGFSEQVLLRAEQAREQTRRDFRIFVLRVAACVAVVLCVAASGWLTQKPVVIPAPEPVVAAPPPAPQTPKPATPTMQQQVDSFFDSAIDSFKQLKEEILTHDSSEK